MMHKSKVWTFLQNKLELNLAVALLYVVESNGSSPGRKGFHMAVCENGEMCGSIGGGIMELKLVELTKKQLQLKMVTIELIKQIHDKKSKRNQSGMICSGDQTIVKYPILENDLTTIKILTNSISNNESVTLVLNEKGISLELTAKQHEYDLGLSIISDQQFRYKEKLGFQQEIHIIGGGHCALALSALFSTMDFEIHVYEERAQLNTLLANKYAQHVHVLDDYSQIQSLIKEGENIYVVIMTVGYRTDDIALKALLGKRFKYLGMLGSATKIEKLLQQYSNDVDLKKWLKHLRAPIGVPIKSKTPQEIAVSIAAEIILYKNQ